MSRLLLDSPLLLSTHGKTDGDPGGFLEQRGLRDAMAVVLRGENNMVGTMLIANRLGEVTGFDDEDLRLLEMLANQTGVILERGRLQHSLSQLTVLQDQLRHEASHDPLTGMANRLLFGSRVEQALAQTGQHVGVLFIDIDDFKTVNDSLGHAAGDELLRAIADRIGQCLRPGDVAARLGGDEFAVLLIGIDEPATAVRIAERVIEALREPFIIASGGGADPREHRHRDAPSTRSATARSCSRTPTSRSTRRRARASPDGSCSSPRCTPPCSIAIA